MGNTTNVKRNSLKAWVLAARPKTLTGALIPVMLGTAMAFQHGQFDWLLALLCALFAVSMQILANFVNDLYDFLHGTDREDRLGPERACAQGWISARRMKVGILVMAILACAFGLLAVCLTWEMLPYLGMEFIIIGVLCLVFANLYTTVCSYNGMGDILVLVFFGIIPVCGTFYLQAKAVDANVFLLSVISGIAIDALLVINNYRDRDQDTLSGKNTLIVKFGESFGRNVYMIICVIVDILMLILCLRGIISLLGFCITAGIYTLLYIFTWRQMIIIHSGKALNKILGQTSRNMFILGLLLSLAIVFNTL